MMLSDQQKYDWDLLEQAVLPSGQKKLNGDLLGHWPSDHLKHP
jgi:hypothetical protein